MRSMCRYEGVCALRRKHLELFQTLPDDFSLARPFLGQQLSLKAVFDFLLQHNNKLFFCVSELLGFLSSCFLGFMGTAEFYVTHMSYADEL
eukprot:61631-Pelagomonas_calceolata.AAC.2